MNGSSGNSVINFPISVNSHSSFIASILLMAFYLNNADFLMLSSLFHLLEHPNNQNEPNPLFLSSIIARQHFLNLISISLGMSLPIFNISIYWQCLLITFLCVQSVAFSSLSSTCSSSSLFRTRFRYWTHLQRFYSYTRIIKLLLFYTLLFVY